MILTTKTNSIKRYNLCLFITLMLFLIMPITYAGSVNEKICMQSYTKLWNKLKESKNCIYSQDGTPIKVKCGALINPKWTRVAFAQCSGKRILCGLTASTSKLSTLAGILGYNWDRAYYVKVHGCSG